MKAPDSYNDYYGGDFVNARQNFCSLRKIIAREYLSDGEHWLRFRYLGAPTVEGYKSFILPIDYIEIVPLHIVSDPLNPEDRH